MKMALPGACTLIGAVVVEHLPKPRKFKHQHLPIRIVAYLQGSSVFQSEQASGNLTIRGFGEGTFSIARPCQCSQYGVRV